jgi:hypothetical protein
MQLPLHLRGKEEYFCGYRKKDYRRKKSDPSLSIQQFNGDGGWD